CSAEAHVRIELQPAHVRPGAGHLPGAVARPVVHHPHLGRGGILAQHRVHTLTQPLPTIPVEDQHGASRHGALLVLYGLAMSPLAWIIRATTLLTPQLNPTRSDQPIVSVIVVSFNGAADLAPCLGSITRQTFPALELLVVDNASVDGSAALAQRDFPRARLIRNEANLGFAAGCNRGIALARGRILFFVNQDAVLHDGCVNAVVSAFETYPDAGIIGCKNYEPDGVTLQHAGGTLAPNGLSNHIGRGEVDRGQYDRVADATYVTGAALAVRQEVFDRCGVFNERYFPAYFEETELCLKARRAGFRVIYLPQAALTHKEAASSGSSASRGYRLAYHRNRLRFVVGISTVRQLFTEFLPSEVRWLLHGAPPWDAPALLEAYRGALRDVLRGRTGQALKGLR